MRTILSITAITVAAALAMSACGATSLSSHLVPEVSDDTSAREIELKRLIRREGATAERYAELAGLQLALKKTRAAKASVQRAIGLDSEHVGAMIIGARASLATKDPERALHYYTKAVEARPKARSAIAKEWSLAIISVGKRRAAAGSASGVLAAIDMLDARLPKRAASLRKQRSVLLLTAARLYLTQGDADRGGDALARARAAGADTGSLLFLQAAKKLVDDDLAGARRDFETWVKRRPSAKRWTAIGDFCRVQRRYSLALEAYQRAAGTSSKELRRIARVALKAKKPEVARQAWEKLALIALKAKGKDASADVLLTGGRALEDRAYLKRAHLLYLKAVELAPARWSVIEAVGLFLSERYDHVGDVPKLVERHMNATNWSAEALGRSIKLLVSSQQVIMASKLVSSAQKRPNAPAVLWLHQAELMHLQQNGGGREAALKTYLKRAGADKLEVLTAAGRAWLRYKVLTRAQQLASAAYAKAPNDPRAALLMADVHSAQRRGVDEKRVLDTFLAGASDKSQAALDVGRRYYERNDFQTAIRHLNTAARAKSKTVRRQAHKLLFELYFQGPPASRAVAARQLRAWLQLVPSKRKRERVLRRLLDDTADNSSLRAVRLEVVTQLLDIKPKDGALLAALGHVHLAAKRYTEAREAYERALAVSERRADDAQRYGDKFAQKGKQEHALHFYDLLAPEEVRGDPRSHLGLGERYDKHGRRRRATRHFQLYLRWLLRRPSTRLLRIFGERMLRARRTGLAVKAFEAALKKNPREQSALLGLGKAFLKRGEVEAARLVMERYIASQTGQSRKRNALSTVATEFERTGALSDAARVMEEHLAFDRSKAARLFPRIARLYRRMGNHEALFRLGRLYADLAKPRRAPALVAVARELEKAGLAERAYALLAKALTAKRRRPADKQSLVEAAGVNALKRADLTKALEHFEELALLRNSRPSEWRRIAAMLANAGHPGPAARFLDHPLSQVDADASLFIERGRYLLQAGKIEQAHKDFVQALTRTLSISDVLTQIEKIYRANGQLGRLRIILGRAVQLMPARSQHFLSLGRLFLDAGRAPEASQAFQRYLAVKERGQIDVARAYAKAGFPKRALAHYARSYEHTTDADRALREAARLLVQLGLTDQLNHHVQRYLLASDNPGRGFRTVADVWETIAGDAKRALNWQRRAWESGPSDKDHFKMGELAYVAGKPDIAQAEFKNYIARAVAGQPGRRNHARMRTPVGLVLKHYLRRGEHGQAMIMLEHAINMVGGSPWLTAKRVQLLIRVGQVNKGLELLAEDPKVLGKAGSAADGIIFALVKRDRLEEALAVVDKALAMQRSDSLTRWRLKLRARLGLVEDAAATAEELVRQGSPEQRFYAGQLLFSEGVLGPAKKHLMSVIKEARGVSLITNRHGRRKTAALRRVANATTLLINAQAHRGKVLSAKGRAEILAQAADTGEDLVASYSLQAHVLYDAGDYQAAVTALDNALLLSPEDKHLREQLFRACIMRNDGPGLFRRLEALPGMTNRAAELDTIARLATRMHQPNIALDATDRALNARAGSTSMRLKAVELAMRSGDEDAVERHALGYVKALNRSKRAYLQLAALAAQHLYIHHAERWATQSEGVAGLDLHVLNLVRLGIAVHHNKTGHKGGALKVIAKGVATVLAAAPDKRVAQLQVAELFDDLGGPADQMLALLKPLVDGKRTIVRALELAISTAWRTGDSALARTYLQRLAKQHPGRLAKDTARRLATELLDAAVAAKDVAGTVLVIDLSAAGGQVAWDLRASGTVLPGQAVMLTQLSRTCERHYKTWDEPTRQAFAKLIRGRLMQPARVRGLGAEDLARNERVVRLLMGHAEESFAVYDAVLARRPSSTAMANNVAYELAQAKRELPRALKLVRRAIALDQPFNNTGDERSGNDTQSMYLDTEAWVLYRMGRYKEALLTQRRAVRLGRQSWPKSAGGALAVLRSVFPLFRSTSGAQTEILYHLGMIQRANRLERSARNTFRDCARRNPVAYYARKCRAALSEPPPR